MFHKEDAIYTIKYIIECHILSTNKYISRTIQGVSEIIVPETPRSVWVMILHAKLGSKRRVTTSHLRLHFHSKT